MRNDCPRCGHPQLAGSLRCPKCRWSGFEAEEVIQDHIDKTLLLDTSQPKDIYEYYTKLSTHGGEQMKVETVATGGDFLKADFVKSNKIVELKITNKDDFEYVTFPGKNGKKDQTKLQTKVIYNNYKPGSDMPNKWTMNAKSQNALIKAWGDNTDNWVNKKIPITVGGEGEMQHILVDELRIE